MLLDAGTLPLLTPFFARDLLGRASTASGKAHKLMTGCLSLALLFSFVSSFQFMVKRKPPAEEDKSSKSQVRLTEAMSREESYFRETSAANAQSLVDGVRLKPSGIILPWLGFGTYKLGKETSLESTYQALKAGYRQIDTAFIYGGETTERNVGKALKQAIEDGVLENRDAVFLTTKHWRKYHGYEPTLECLRLSLKRLEVDYIDLWLMHWPGPAYRTMARRKDVEAWEYATTDKDSMSQVRAETWRAMEDAVDKGVVKAIGVCNMTVEHLKCLKKTARLWPPAVNQVEFHPLQTQAELRKYCTEEGIVLQAYASLGGQDTGKKVWNKVLGAASKEAKRLGNRSILNAEAVLDLAHECGRTPAQVLLRWALQQEVVLIPKTSVKERLHENAEIFSFTIPQEKVIWLAETLSSVAKSNVSDEAERSEMTRLCWRNDPLRMLDFN